MSMLPSSKTLTGPTRSGRLVCARGKGFLIIPQELVWAGRNLSHGERMTWLAIFQHNWTKDQTERVSWPGRKKLAVMLGISVRQLTTYLDGLKRKGLLKSKRRANNTNLYLLKDPLKVWMRETERKWKRTLKAR